MLTFDYPEADVGANSYDVYADVDQADTYNAGQISAVGWASATSDTKGQGLVSATRWLDEAQWQGEKTDPTQALAWPRTGIEGVDPDTLPTALQDACCALAAQMIDDPSLRTSLGAPLPREMHAGSVGMSFFRPKDVYVASFFPPSIMSLVGQWIAGSGNGDTAGPIVDGVCAESPFDEDLGFQHGI